MIEFGEHEGMKRVVDRRRYFRCNDSVSLSIHKGSHPVRAGRPQRRSGKGGNENASYQAADLRQSQSRHASDAGCSQQRHRPAFEDSDLGRRPGESLGFVQQPGLLKGAARTAAGAAAKYRRGRNTGGQSWRVVSASMTSPLLGQKSTVVTTISHSAPRLALQKKDGVAGHTHGARHRKGERRGWS